MVFEQVLTVLNEKKAIEVGKTAGKRTTRSTRRQIKLPNCIPRRLPRCDLDPRAKYWRNDNGQCNNLKHVRRGAVMTAQARLLPARYHNQIWEPIQLDSERLPLLSPRLISTSIIDTSPVYDRLHTTLLVLFGQFVAHDIVSSGTERPKGLESCCMDVKLPPKKLHKDCYPIHVPQDDYLYGSIHMNCMNQFRSRLASFEDCVARPASPANQATHYLDASIIYGSDSHRAGQLRAKTGGLIEMDEDKFLPMKDGK